MKRIKKIPFIVGLLVIMIIPVIVLSILGGTKTKNLEVEKSELQTTWYYINDEGKETPVSIHTHYDVLQNEEFVIYTTVPNEPNTFNTIMIQSEQQRIKVFVEDKLIYDNSTSEYRLIGKAEQSKWHLAYLPDDIEGKTIKVSFTCPYEVFSGYVSTVRIGYRDAFVTEIYAKHFPYLCIGFCLLISTLVLLISTVLLLKKNKEIKKMSGLVGAIAFLSLSVICESKIISLYSNMYISSISYVSLILFAIMFAYYLINSFEKKNALYIFYLVMMFISFGQFVFAMTSHIIGFLDLFQTLPISLGIIFLETLTFTYIKIYQLVAAKKEKVTKFKNVFEAILAILIFVFFVTSMIVSYPKISYYVVPCALFLVYVFYRYAASLTNVISDAKKSIEYESQLKETKNYLIQSQMKSHFIFNTLGAIRTMIVSSPNTAYDMMTDFTKYLRANISNISPNEQIPFAQELDHIKAYVNIEKQRFQKRLNVEYDIQCDSFLIPPLSVEPLVENAVKHGVCKKLKGGTVKIRTQELDDKYLIIVEDDGVGFDTAILDEETKKDSVGLKYIKIRLETLANADFVIESTPKVGTKATITIKKQNN